MRPLPRSLRSCCSRLRAKLSARAIRSAIPAPVLSPRMAAWPPGKVGWRSVGICTVGLRLANRNRETESPAMMIERLLRETLATGLGLLMEAGSQSETVSELYERFTQDVDDRFHLAFEQAWHAAKVRLSDEVLTPLLDHRPFQEAVVSALIDPALGFNVSSATEILGERYASTLRPLRRWFDILNSNLEDEEHWGALLEQYQALQEAGRSALYEQQLDASVQTVIHRVRACLASDGAIAQDHSVAAGAHGIAVGRDVHKIVIEQLVMQGGGSATNASLRQRYLARLCHQCYALPLAALGGEATPHKSVGLDQVYIDLHTTAAIRPSTLEALRRGEVVDVSQLRTRQEFEAPEVFGRLTRSRRSDQDDDDEPQPLAVLDALRLSPHMVLLGDPGAGKSSFVRIVTAQLAAGLSTAGIPPSVLPIFVILRDVVSSLAAVDLDALPVAQHDDALD